MKLCIYPIVLGVVIGTSVFIRLEGEAPVAVAVISGVVLLALFVCIIEKGADLW